MEPPVFFAPPDSFRDEIIELSKMENHHAGTVLRLRRGDIVLVVDGLGNACRGEIQRAGRSKSFQVRVHTRLRNYGEATVRLTLAAGLSTGSKLDTIVQKATELGIKRFVPILSEKSRVKLDDPKRAASRLRRLEKVALAAVKQSRRSYRPDVSNPVSLEQFLKETDRTDVNLVFHPTNEGRPLDECIADTQTPRVTLLVGPEAGFTPEEVSAAGEAGFRVVSLGRRVLRSETAAPVACALVMALLGELR